MINIPISISLPDLWDAKTFSKTEWGEINLIVGPNGGTAYYLAFLMPSGTSGTTGGINVTGCNPDVTACNLYIIKYNSVINLLFSIFALRK